MGIFSMGITIKYYDGSINTVDNSTKKSVDSALSKADKKLEGNFFKNLSIHVASDFSNLDTHNTLSTHLKEDEKEYSNTTGLTTDSPYSREIYIQESAFKFDKIANLFTSLSFSANEKIEHATMHEIGHQFDLFYGTEEDIKQKYKELIKKYNYTYKEINITEDEEKFIDFYKDHNGYSDSAEFKEAILFDLQNMQFEKFSSLYETYFIADFYERGIEDNINIDDVQAGDYSRGEVFAQLFAYAMGTDDGCKEKFLKNFQNSYKVVLNYIQKHSK